MNCKQGDIAIVVRGKDAGVMVECLEFIGYHRCLDGSSAPDCWRLRSLCSYRFMFTDGPRLEGVGRDSSLRPLRGDIENERLDEEIAA